MALAQTPPASWPLKPVNLIVPLAAGGPVDVETRLYAGRLAEISGQSFLVDYKVGAAGTIAAAYVAKSAPDGYTLLVVPGAFTTFAALYQNLAFDPMKDFAPVSLMSKRPQVLIAAPSFPARNIAEYIAYARANPGKINYATTGEGSGSHLGGAWLHHDTGTSVTFVHYKGTGPIVPDLMAGRVDVTTAAVSVVAPLAKAAKVKPLAMTSDRRSPMLADLPTIAEATLPGYDQSSWTGVSAPGSTPAALVNRINALLVKVARLPEVSRVIEGDGNEVVASSPAKFRDIIQEETEHWRKLVREIGIKQGM